MFLFIANTGAATPALAHVAFPSSLGFLRLVPSYRIGLGFLDMQSKSMNE